ncbi:hypothetical protein DAPPUDRAFT_108775 [Daphnia pulex]|uniref:Uncharacterized protein n=1 Tax=Daphnia pulex TaxID=6669 RepID=E9H151_DAPPU|nr:hypothetical protein DAPPUDRAFT_108775 [Daphnia pulex]|eukprot:EFX74573.1 hypothetical protein DAPPUDRAFT_108775 [Daphnia pulex]
MKDAGRSWDVYRRYTEFCRLHAVLKKQIAGLNLKLPGKRLFGSNFDPAFLKSRCDGLTEYIRLIINDGRLLSIREVREFLSLDERSNAKKSANSDDSGVETRNINLGPSERPLKPDDFEFLRVLGRGSFGKVLLARRYADQHLYAVKVLEKRAVVRRNETQHIMAERNVLRNNQLHPFLVSLHASFQTREKLYFVLDFVNGGELFFHLQRERHFSEARARFYSAEMASALGYLHSAGVVYRDLKPENILLDSEGHLVLTDFGLCKEGLVDSDQTTATFCGTPEYLAPEVIRKEAYGRSVDWWCLGAVLYEMLYGLPPFYSRDTAVMYDAILNKPLHFRDHIQVSTAGKDLLSALLQKDGRTRLGSGPADFDDVRNHAFYRSLNWDDLMQRKMTPPFRPELSDAYDLRNIDPEFTREPVPASLLQARSVRAASSLGCNRDGDNVFAGFSYVPTTLIN